MVTHQYNSHKHTRNTANQVLLVSDSLPVYARVTRFTDENVFTLNWSRLSADARSVFRPFLSFYLSIFDSVWHMVDRMRSPRKQCLLTGRSTSMSSWRISAALLSINIGRQKRQAFMMPLIMSCPIFWRKDMTNKCNDSELSLSYQTCNSTNRQMQPSNRHKSQTAVNSTQTHTLEQHIITFTDTTQLNYSIPH